MKNYLKDMALFVEIARTGTFTKASVSTGIPVSTVSRRLTEFEKSLGFQLIKRSTRKLELTALGQQYFTACERLVAEAEVAHEKLLEGGDQIEGILKLSMTPDFGPQMLAPLLGRFAKAYPLVKFELDLTPHLTDLIADDFDVAIRFGNPVDSGLTMRRIGTVQHWICATPNYIAQHGAPVHPHELAAHSGIVIRRANQPPALFFEKNGQRMELKTAARFYANQMSMIVALVLMDLGVAQLPDAMARRWVEDGKLIRLMPDWQLPSVPVLAITPSRMQPARCRLFLDFLADNAADIFLASHPPPSPQQQYDQVHL